MTQKNEIIYNNENLKPVLNKRVVVAISREYGSGGRYVGEIISKKFADQLNVPWVIYISTVSFANLTV